MRAAAEDELRVCFERPRTLLSTVLTSISDCIEEQLLHRNGALPPRAPVVTMHACQRRVSKGMLRSNEEVRLTTSMERDWSSFGYSVAHLSSRSTGGEAGTLLPAIFCPVILLQARLLAGCLLVSAVPRSVSDTL
jgi:hypothetical protein